MTEIAYSEAFNAAKAQSEGNLRYGRVTASRLYDVLRLHLGV